MQEQPSYHLVAARALSQSSISSYVCTGGTTGSPKIAVRTHGNEVFDAWAVGQIIEGSASQRTFFCGLPLFHVNAQLITGLLPWMQGHHVVLGTRPTPSIHGLSAGVSWTFASGCTGSSES